MGGQCSTCRSRCPGTFADEGVGPVPEYEPAKGSGEEVDSFQQEEFKVAAAVASKALKGAEDAQVSAAFLQAESALEACRKQSGQSEGWRPQQDHHHGGRGDEHQAHAAAGVLDLSQLHAEFRDDSAEQQHAPDRKAQAQLALQEALARAHQSGAHAADLERAMDQARQMEVPDRDLSAAQARLEALRLIESRTSTRHLPPADFQAAMGDTQTLDKETLARERQKQEEEVRANYEQFQSAVAAALADKDIARLQDAIDFGVHRHIHQLEVDDARSELEKLQLDLASLKPDKAKKGGCLCCGSKKGAA